MQSDVDDLTSHPLRRPLAQCPACGSVHLDAVVETERQDVHFLCRDCCRCWKVELGYVHRMTPYTCLGCPERACCDAIYANDRTQVTAPFS